MSRVVDKDAMPINTWYVEGRLLAYGTGSVGSITVYLEEDNARRWYQLRGDCRFSVGEKEIGRDEFLRLIGEYARLEEKPRVVLGIDLSGVWGVSVRPYDALGAMKAFMN